MKAVFIAYDQAHHDAVIEILDKNSCRGFTSFGEVQGRGSDSGEPHYGSHAWPSLDGAILTVVDDNKMPVVMEALHALDKNKPRLGLRAFAWDIIHTI